MAARHVFTTMGTTVSLHAEDPVDRGALIAVEEVFAGYCERFSLYLPDSELSHVADGSLALMDATPVLRDVYEQAVHWRTLTRGAFSPHRPDDVIDLSGIVKALAIHDAGDVLDTVASSWSIGCGGDVLTRRPSARPASVGITDPADRSALLAAVDMVGPRRAIATSGVSERGEHVWGPRVDFQQVTVIADDIVTADVLATAILAGGRVTCDEVTASIDCDVLAVLRDGRVLASPGIPRTGRPAPPPSRSR